MNKVTIAIDAMGGDNAPNEVIKGAVKSLENENIKIILVGDEKLINENLQNLSYDKNRISIINTTEIILNNETPTKAIKDKKDSSMVVGLNLLKNNEASAFISAGSTGALLTGATLIVGRINGIKRPALAGLLPNSKGHSLLLDIGANVDCKPEYLKQFAIMGSLYMENVVGIKNPSVGLVNIGTEEGKGNELTKETFKLLKETNLNFIGNIEARDIPSKIADVLVCDAFVGNVILKLSEGILTSFMSLIKKELLKGFITKIGGMLSKPAFLNIKKKFDYREIGGVPFLGLKSLVIKAHGSSDEKAFYNAIKQCYKFINADLVLKIEEMVSNSKEKL